MLPPAAFTTQKDKWQVLSVRQTKAVEIHWACNMVDFSKAKKTTVPLTNLIFQKAIWGRESQNTELDVVLHNKELPRVLFAALSHKL